MLQPCVDSRRACARTCLAAGVVSQCRSERESARTDIPVISTLLMSAVATILLSAVPHLEPNRARIRVPVPRGPMADTSAWSGPLAMFKGRMSLVPRGPSTVRFQYWRQSRRFDKREDIPLGMAWDFHAARRCGRVAQTPVVSPIKGRGDSVESKEQTL
jgi:hypothetical protein